MTTYASFTTLARAAQRLTEQFASTPKMDARAYDAYLAKVQNIDSQLLGNLWSNPGDKVEASRISQELNAAFYSAANR